MLDRGDRASRRGPGVRRGRVPTRDRPRHAPDPRRRRAARARSVQRDRERLPTLGPPDRHGQSAKGPGAADRADRRSRSGDTPEIQPTVFEAFARGADDGHGGSGLGLAIAKGFVEANRGTIAVESLPGQGTTFVVELPLEPVPSPEGAAR